MPFRDVNPEKSLEALCPKFSIYEYKGIRFATLVIEYDSTNFIRNTFKANALNHYSIRAEQIWNKFFSNTSRFKQWTCL